MVGSRLLSASPGEPSAAGEYSTVSTQVRWSAGDASGICSDDLYRTNTGAGLSFLLVKGTKATTSSTTRPPTTTAARAAARTP